MPIIASGLEPTTMNTIAIVGAGPLLGLSIARRFGREGFRVALVARRAEALAEYSAQLRGQGIEAAGFAADITDPQQLADAFQRIKAAFGPITVLEFSPTDWGKGGDKSTTPTGTTAQQALADFKLLVMGAIDSARLVLPDMQAAGSGTLLFATGYSAVEPLPFITALSVANAGVRNYALCLHQELAAQNIHVATIAINALIAAGTPGDPDLIAELFWDIHQRRDRAEAVFSDGLH
jgi:short-subunit dehydrogenase